MNTVRVLEPRLKHVVDERNETLGYCSVKNKNKITNTAYTPSGIILLYTGKKTPQTEDDKRCFFPPRAYTVRLYNNIYTAYTYYRHSFFVTFFSIYTKAHMILLWTERDDFYFVRIYLQRSEFLFEKRILASVLDLPHPPLTTPYERQRNGHKDERNKHHNRYEYHPRLHALQFGQCICKTNHFHLIHNVSHYLYINSVMNNTYIWQLQYIKITWTKNKWLTFDFIVLDIMPHEIVYVICAQKKQKY